MTASRRLPRPCLSRLCAFAVATAATLALAATAHAADAAGAAGAAGAASSGWNLDRLMATLAQNKSGRATFVETKYLSIAAQPVESSGELVFVARMLSMNAPNSG